MAMEKIHRKKQPWLYEKYLKEQGYLAHPNGKSNVSVMLLTTVKYIIPLVFFVVGILLML